MRVSRRTTRPSERGQSNTSSWAPDAPFSKFPPSANPPLSSTQRAPDHILTRQQHQGAAHAGPAPRTCSPHAARSSVSECVGRVSLVEVGARAARGGLASTPPPHMLRCAALRALRPLHNARLAATTDVHG
eukprot:5513816-Prymnesium_polylepis.1